jgi:hypothetical protein
MSARTWILGVAIHHSSFDYPRWHPQRGIPPHTFYAETIVDLAAAADNPDDVVAWVSRGIARHLVSEAQLKTARSSPHNPPGHADSAAR